MRIKMTKKQYEQLKNDKRPRAVILADPANPITQRNMLAAIQNDGYSNPNWFKPDPAENERTCEREGCNSPLRRGKESVIQFTAQRFCSVKCGQMARQATIRPDPVRFCRNPMCQNPQLVRRRGEGKTMFSERVYCSRHCQTSDSDWYAHVVIGKRANAKPHPVDFRVARSKRIQGNYDAGIYGVRGMMYTDDEIREIRASPLSDTQIAKEKGGSRRLIGDIVNGKYYKNVEGPPSSKPRGRGRRLDLIMKKGGN